MGKTITVKWSGRGMFCFDYNGKRFAFKEIGMVTELPIEAYIHALTCGNIFASNLVPVTGEEALKELNEKLSLKEAENKDLLEQIADLQKAIEDMQSVEEDEPVKTNKKGKK